MGVFRGSGLRGLRVSGLGLALALSEPNILCQLGPGFLYKPKTQDSTEPHHLCRHLGRKLGDSRLTEHGSGLQVDSKMNVRLLERFTV